MTLWSLPVIAYQFYVSAHILIKSVTLISAQINYEKPDADIKRAAIQGFVRQPSVTSSIHNTRLLLPCRTSDLPEVEVLEECKRADGDAFWCHRAPKTQTSHNIKIDTESRWCAPCY